MALDRNRLLRPVKKLRKVINKIDREASAENVHDLRTNSRRFEAIFEALSLETRGVGKSLLKELRRYRKRAGKVRDMDVLTGYASKIHLKGEEECLVRLLEHLGVRRHKYARKLHSEISRHGAEVRADLKDVSTALAALAGDTVQAPNKATDVTATATKLASQLATPRRLSKDNLHSYRLKIKQLQSVLQIAAGRSPVFVRDLGKVKNAIGEWHDWHQLVLATQEVIDHGTRCGLLARLKRIVKGKYEHALSTSESLRKKYVQSSVRAGDEDAVPGPLATEAIAMLGSERLPPRSETRVNRIPLSTSA